MSHRTRIFLAVLSVAVISLAGAAFATNPSGLTSTTPVRGLLGPIDVKHDNIELETEGQTSADVAVASAASSSCSGSRTASSASS